jgi:hypothetical protein
MRALSDADCLDLWDHGLRRHPLDRALLILDKALPDTPYEDLADWPLGRCNKALAELYNRCFGPTLNAWLSCERCEDKLEFEIDVHIILGGEPARDDPVHAAGRAFRLPTTRDLACAAEAGEPAAIVRRLLESCQVQQVDHGPWSEAEIEEIGETMAAADPLAETRLMFRCPSCSHEWAASFDIAAFVWEQTEARARRAVADVHALARAYGWTETEILSLTGNRRAHYLELVQA